MLYIVCHRARISPPCARQDGRRFVQALCAKSSIKGDHETTYLYLKTTPYPKCINLRAGKGVMWERGLMWQGVLWHLTQYSNVISTPNYALLLRT